MNEAKEQLKQGTALIEGNSSNNEDQLIAETLHTFSNSDTAIQKHNPRRF